jgi:hypothetical protein
VPGVGIQVVGAPPGLQQFYRGVTLLDGVLAGAHDADTGRPQLTVGPFELALHLIERLLPGDRDKVALLVEAAVLLAQQRLRQAVLAVVDLGVGVTLDAEKTAVHIAIGVSLDGHHPLVLGGDLDTTTHSAEAARPLVPAPAALGIALGQDGLDSFRE